MCQQISDEQPNTETLATCAGLGSITLCPCGTVSLHVGGVSVRMEMGAFMQAAKMCHLAMLSLDGHVRALTQAGNNSSTVTH
jgi:hypothetical protein